MTGGLHIDHYEWRSSSGIGGREMMLRFGKGPPRVVLALPLFEEFNRTRAFGVTLLHALAARGVGGLLPDWPATNDSLIPTNAARLSDIRNAYRAITDHYGSLFAVGIRSGALFDSDANVRARWHFSPQSSDDLIRELSRQTSVEGDIAGNIVSPAMLDDLAAAQPRAARVVRLDSDPRDADLKLPCAPLWRRAEPGNDPILATLLADDIAAWISTCAA